MKDNFKKAKKPTWQETKQYMNDLKKSLWLSNPRCCYCGVVTEFTKRRRHEPLADNYPTIEHIYPKHDLRRYCVGGTKKLTIACNKCNCEKSKEGSIILRMEFERGFSILNFINDLNQV